MLWLHKGFFSWRPKACKRVVLRGTFKVRGQRIPAFGPFGHVGTCPELQSNLRDVKGGFLARDFRSLFCSCHPDVLSRN